MSQSSKQNDYYEVLQLDRHASKADIKKKYRMLILEYHPDKNPDNPEDAKEKFIAIYNAYGVLIDDGLRGDYDAGRFKREDEDEAAAQAAFEQPDFDPEVESLLQQWTRRKPFPTTDFQDSFGCLDEIFRQYRLTHQSSTGGDSRSKKASEKIIFFTLNHFGKKNVELLQQWSKNQEETKADTSYDKNSPLDPIVRNGDGEAQYWNRKNELVTVPAEYIQSWRSQTPQEITIVHHSLLRRFELAVKARREQRNAQFDRLAKEHTREWNRAWREVKLRASLPVDMDEKIDWGEIRTAIIKILDQGKADYYSYQITMGQYEALARKYRFPPEYKQVLEGCVEQPGPKPGAKQSTYVPPTVEEAETSRNTSPLSNQPLPLHQPIKGAKAGKPVVSGTPVQQTEVNNPAIQGPGIMSKPLQQGQQEQYEQPAQQKDPSGQLSQSPGQQGQTEQLTHLSKSPQSPGQLVQFPKQPVSSGQQEPPGQHMQSINQPMSTSASWSVVNPLAPTYSEDREVLPDQKITCIDDDQKQRVVFGWKQHCGRDELLLYDCSYTAAKTMIEIYPGRAYRGTLAKVKSSRASDGSTEAYPNWSDKKACAEDLKIKDFHDLTIAAVARSRQPTFRNDNAGRRILVFFTMLKDDKPEIFCAPRSDLSAIFGKEAVEARIQNYIWEAEGRVPINTSRLLDYSSDDDDEEDSGDDSYLPYPQRRLLAGESRQRLVPRFEEVNEDNSTASNLPANKALVALLKEASQDTNLDDLAAEITNLQLGTPRPEKSRNTIPRRSQRPQYHPHSGYEHVDYGDLTRQYQAGRSQQAMVPYNQPFIPQYNPHSRRIPYGDYHVQQYVDRRTHALINARDATRMYEALHDHRRR